MSSAVAAPLRQVSLCPSVNPARLLPKFLPGERQGRSQSGLPPLMGDIGLIGLGHMGTAMAANLASAGRPVIAYVRRADQFAQLEALGLRPTTDIGDLLGCEVVISMLPDDDCRARGSCSAVVTMVLRAWPRGLIPGAIHLSMSTISTAAASLLAGEHARRGQGYVAAPVSAIPDAAKARQLFILAAGAPPMWCAASRSLTVSDKGLLWLAPIRKRPTLSSCSAT